MGSKPQPVPRTKIDPLLVESILSSQPFARSQRMCRFLRLLIERSNQGNLEQLKETEIGVLVFDREVGYDPKIDSIVRSEGTRLRRKLSEYYAGEGLNSPVRLYLPPGRYELELHPNVHPVPVVAAPVPQARRLPYQAAMIGVLAVVGILVWQMGMRSPKVPT